MNIGSGDNDPRDKSNANSRLSPTNRTSGSPTFSTMSHEMVAAALGLMCIPFLYIRLILRLLRAPYLYSVGKGYV